MDPLEQQLRARLKPPMWAEGTVAGHVLGTDEFGRDVLSRIIHGARVSLAVGVLVVLVAGPIGILVGLLAGYYGGAVESLLMRLADAQHALPGILLAIIIVAVLGASLLNLVLVLAVTTWVVYARVVFTSVRSLREWDYVRAAAALGASDARILAHHVLPGTQPDHRGVGAAGGYVILLEAACRSWGSACLRRASGAGCWPTGAAGSWWPLDRDVPGTRAGSRCGA
jgi:peptide/nickel transport system permease protein